MGQTRISVTYSHVRFSFLRIQFELQRQKTRTHFLSADSHVHRCSHKKRPFNIKRHYDASVRGCMDKLMASR